MSFSADQVRRIDAHLDRIQLGQTENHASLAASSTSTYPGQTHEHGVNRLQSLIRILSTSSGRSRPVLPAAVVRACLAEATSLVGRPDLSIAIHSSQQSTLEGQLAWLLVFKATTQVYGLTLDRLLQDTVALTDESWYWDQVLSSRLQTAFYGIQTLPLRAYDWLRLVWSDVKQKQQRGSITASSRNAIASTWHDFYRVVDQVVRQRNFLDMRTRVLGPVATLRAEMRSKQDQIAVARKNGANALGMLVERGLLNSSRTLDKDDSEIFQSDLDDWKTNVAESADVMTAILDHGSITTSANPDQSLRKVLHTLMTLVDQTIPRRTASVSSVMTIHGRPSALIRYWPVVTLAVLSSSTVFRIVLNRQAEILTWIQDLGATIIDFWRNWVVEPTRKVIGTIRHDEGSEVSIMSKRSLQGDRDSLERMVIDFAVDNPTNATDTGAPLTASEIAEIRSKVREGDLTPVLRAYEKDLASPLAGTIRGNLIRALLIQVQKTKVDVEIAMGGIDALLKSQELVFGFVGLTPGILVSVALFRWMRQASAGRRALHRQHKQGVVVGQLRNIDRLLADPANLSHDRARSRQLEYRSFGLLLCEVHVLSQQARRTMPGQTYRELARDLEELVDVKAGVDRQSRVVERIRWAYAKWL